MIPAAIGAAVLTSATAGIWVKYGGRFGLLAIGITVLQLLGLYFLLCNFGEHSHEFGAMDALGAGGVLILLNALGISSIIELSPEVVQTRVVRDSLYMRACEEHAKPGIVAQLELLKGDNPRAVFNNNGNYEVVGARPEVVATRQQALDSARETMHVHIAPVAVSVSE